MSGDAQEKIRYRFGPFELETGEGKLSRNGSPIKLQDLPYRLLVLLLERPGEIVSREDVRQRLWPENTFVEFDNSLGVAVRKIRDSLGDDAEAPRYVETIPRRGYRFRAPVTIQEPAKPAPQQDPVLVPPLPDADRQRPRIGRIALVAILALIVAGGVGYAIRSFPRRVAALPNPSIATPPARIRRSVAVLGFRNLRGRPQDNWLSAAFSEMLHTELAAGGEFRLVSGEDVARAKSELPLADEDTLAKSTLKRLRTDPGADVVVLGSYTPLPGKDTNRIRLDIRIQDTAAGDTLAEESVVGTEEDLFDLVAKASTGIREHLGLTSGSSETAMAARASLPSNRQAVRLYAEGHARSWAFDFIGARDLLRKAVAADPDYPLSHAALSQAWSHLGYIPTARAEAQRARDLASHLPQEERLLIEGQYDETFSNFPKAVEDYQALFHLFPDNLEYGLRLATAQRKVNATESLRTLDVLRHLPPPAGDDPRIDLTEASAWISQDLAKAHAAANRAIAKGNAQGSHLLVARAYGVLCQQGSSVGADMAEAIAACENARQSYAAAGDRNNDARTLHDLAGLYLQQGDLARAAAMWQEAEPVFRRVGDAEGLAAVTNNLGDVFLLQGMLDDAEKFLKRSIPGYEAIEDRSGVAGVLGDLANVSRQRGNLQASVTIYQKAKATAVESDDHTVVAYVLTGLGDTLADQGDLTGARKSYEESLALRNQAGEKQGAAETQIALARISIEEGHAAEVEASIRKCSAQFHSEQQIDDELSASIVLIQALQSEGKSAEAQQEITTDEPLAAKSQNTMLGLEFALASARVVLSSDHPEPARKQLQDIVQKAREHAFAGLALNAQLALAQPAKNTSPAPASRDKLAAVEKEAKAKGFGLIAKKAAAARSAL